MESLPELRRPRCESRQPYDQDRCREYRVQLDAWREKRLETDNPTKLREIESAIKKHEGYLKECESFSMRSIDRSGNLDAALGDWSAYLASVRCNIPHQNSDRFISPPELEQLLNRLTGDTATGTNIVCIDGAIGVGKSALAFYFAQEYYSERFPDGAVYQDVNGKNVEEIASWFLNQCKVPIEDNNPIDSFTAWSRNRRLLFILDHADKSEIQDIFAVGKQCAVIITTRDRLLCENYGMLRIHLKPFHSIQEGITLLQKSIGETGGQRINAELEAAQNIVKLVGNLPLALSIAGSTLNADTSYRLSDYAEDLNEAKLDSLSIGQELKRNVRACFQLSIKKLEPEVVDFFACLSVCATDGFTVDVAVAVGGQPRRVTRIELLPELCRYFLIENDGLSQEDGEIQQRYRFQTLLREFATELAEQRALMASAEQKHQEFIDRIRKIKSLENLADESSNIVIRRNLNDIIYCAEWLKGQEILEYSFGFKFCSFFDRNNAYKHKAVQLMSIFKELAESVNDWEYSVRFRVQQAKYMDRSTPSNLQKAIQLLKPIDELLSRFNATEKYKIEGRYRNTYADVLGANRQYDKAIFQLRKAIKLYQNYPEGLAKAQTSLCNMLRKQHHYEDAVSELRKAVRLEEAMFKDGSTKNEAGWAIALTELGITLGNWGKEHWLEAVHILEKSIALKKTLGQRVASSLSYSWNELGEVLRKLERFKDASAAFKESLVIKIRPHINDQDGIEIVKRRWLVLIQRVQEQGNREDALHFCNQAIQVLPNNHHPEFLRLINHLETR